MRILVVAPHGDDEVLGCGATIARYHQQGHHISVCIMTSAYTPDWSDRFIAHRQIEIARAHQIIGVDRCYQLGFPTVKLDTMAQKTLNDALTKIVKTVNPALLFIPHQGDLNMDHRITFEASLVAARPTHSRIQKIVSYEVLSETDWGHQIEPFLPTIYVEVTSTYEKKLRAMRMGYRSELRAYPHSRSLISLKANFLKRGGEAGLEYAEAFRLIREVL